MMTMRLTVMEALYRALARVSVRWVHPLHPLWLPMSIELQPPEAAARDVPHGAKSGPNYTLPVSTFCLSCVSTKRPCDSLLHSTSNNSNRDTRNNRGMGNSFTRCSGNFH